jgi:hypothetical protein
MTISKNTYTFRTRVLFKPDGSLDKAEIVRKAQLVEEGKVLSEVELDVRTLDDPSPLAPLIAKLNAKFEELYEAEQDAKAKAAEKAAVEAEQVDKMVKGAK